MAFIYKIYNDVNNNLYIGETIRPLVKRWWQHQKAAQDINICGHLQLAMRKYGIDKFHIEIIEECADDIRFDREKYWIEYYNSYYDGYNSSLGGEGATLYQYEEIVELWNEGKNITEICKELGCCDTTVQTVLRANGVTYMDHMIRNQGKPVEQYTTKGEFVASYSCANEAGRSLGLVNGGNIIKCCLGEIKTSKGFIWKYADDNTPIEEIVKNKKKNTTGKVVLQYTLSDEFIAEYESCEQAGKTLGLNGSGINRCARGERKTAYGYKWKYKI